MRADAILHEELSELCWWYEIPDDKICQELGRHLNISPLQTENSVLLGMIREVQLT